MTTTFARTLILLFALWLPLQSATVAAMPVCDEQSGHTLEAVGHAHTSSQDANSATDANTAECAQCAFCHAACMGTLPHANTAWSTVGGDAGSASERTISYGLNPGTLDRPPLERTG